MKLNFQYAVNLLRKFLFGKKICPHWTVWIKKSDACNIQSGLDLHYDQKVIMLCLAVQGSMMNDVLSDLWWYFK